MGIKRKMHIKCCICSCSCCCLVLRPFSHSSRPFSAN